MSETDRDIGNVEAWAGIIETMLALMPEDRRMQVLQLALQKEEAEAKEREQQGHKLRFIDFGNDDWMKGPGIMHWNAIMRLKSLLVQVFARSITNNHSPKEAGRILFADHRHGYGSGRLSEYIDDLPRGRRADKAARRSRPAAAIAES
jgi:hypothetical protein